ncbi:hypothetical protein [Microbacterium sp.]|uniref:hypothetical protein n=1 Tax=Microbacterium sp. TaxID=51671 RepID=UPI0037CCC231
MLSGAIGLTAATALSVEKIEKLTNPEAGLSCDFSVLVQCSANFDSAQGSAVRGLADRAEHLRAGDALPLVSCGVADDAPAVLLRDSSEPA